MREPDIIGIPEVLLLDEDKEQAFLLLKFTKSANEAKKTWDNFSKKLALIHHVEG